MNKFKFLFITSIFTLLLASCDGLDGGMFYSILEETEILDGNLKNNISVGSMVKYVDGSDEYYFIAAGNIYYKTANNSEIPNWVISSPFTNRDDADNKSCITYNMELVGDYLYCVFLENDNNFTFKRTKLSSDIIDSATQKAVSVDKNDKDDVDKISFSFSWEDFTIDNLDSAETLIDIYKSNDHLFLVTQDITTSTNFRTYNIYSTPTSSFSTTSTLTSIANDIGSCGELRVDYDSDTSIYWIVMGNKVYTTDGSSSGTDETPNVITAAKDEIGSEDSVTFKNNGFRGILCSETDTEASGTEIYLSSEEGFLFKRINNAWTVINSDYDEDYGLYFKSLFGLSRITYKKDNTDVDVILIGCREGYYEIQAGANSDGTVVSASSNNNTSLTKYNQFLSIDLSEKIIQNFYFDESNGAVYSLGFLSGLWSNKFNDQYWNAE